MKNLDKIDQIYALVLAIPEGRVTSYGAIAGAINTKMGARQVGLILSKSHNEPVKIPAHRVVNRNGVLTGKFHFGEIDEMQKRLEAEGIVVENDTVKDFKNLFWDPIEYVNLFC